MTLDNKTDSGTKVSPQCVESVGVAARIWRYCRYEFAPAREPSVAARPIRSTIAPMNAVIWSGIIYLVFLLVYRVRKAVQRGPR
jgi:hypothetical protein